MASAINDMKLLGAPLIGVAASYGLALTVVPEFSAIILAITIVALMAYIVAINNRKTKKYINNISQR